MFTFQRRLLNLFRQASHLPRRALAILKGLNSDGYALLLQKCGAAKDLLEGRRLHLLLAQGGGHDHDTFIGNSLVQMYGRCGAVDDACMAFEKIRHPNVFSWTMLVVAYAQNGHLEEARESFERMPRRNEVSWNAMIAAYAQHGDLLEASCMFERMPQQDVLSSNAMIGAYAQSGHLQEARKMFDHMLDRNVVSWNAMIAAYAQNGFGKEVLKMVKEMDLEGVHADKITFIGALDACANLTEGKAIHMRIVAAGWVLDVVVGNAVVNMYGKCGDLKRAKDAFDGMVHQDVVSWNAMISAYVQNGSLQEAKDSVLLKMPQHDVITLTCMITGYAQIGQLQEARSIFNDVPERNVISWNAIITAYVQNEQYEEAIGLVRAMDIKGVPLDKTTFINTIDACGNLAALAEGKIMHEEISSAGLELDVMVGTSLINMYGKCGSVENARSLFEKMPHRSVISWNAVLGAYAQNGYLHDAKLLFDEIPERDVVSWNAMISAYAQTGHAKRAIGLLRLMDLEGVHPDTVTFVTIVHACATLAALPDPTIIHAITLKDEEEGGGFPSDVTVANALIDMFAKCGSLEKASKLFKRLSTRRDVISWTSMIAAYAQTGNATKAFQLFQTMRLEGVPPNEITFSKVLSACSRAGSLEDGRFHFLSMSSDFGMLPTLDNHLCIIDLIGRAGRLAEAQELINCMPFEPTAMAWMTLLAACRVHGDRDGGLQAAHCASELDPEDAAPYVLLSNIFVQNETETDCSATLACELDNGA